MRMDLTRERLDMMLFPGAESRRSFLISDILGEQANTTCSTTLTTTATVTSIDNNSTPFVLYDGDSPLSEATYRPSHPHPYPPPTQKEDPVVVLRRMKQSSDDVERTRNKTPEYDEAMDRVDSETMESSFNPRGVKLPRKTRTIFTEQQLSSLELSFEQRKYLGIRDRLNLASKLQLTDAQVKTWYQNRRTKWKRETAGSYKMAPNQDNMAFLCRLLQGHQNSVPLTRPKIIFSHEICAPEAHFNFPSSSCLYQSGDEILHPIRPMLPPLLLLRDLNIPNP